MNFELSDDQQQLKQTLERLVAREYGFDMRRRVIDSERGFSVELWRTFAEIGLLALPFCPDDGGLGGSAAETRLVMQTFGSALVVEPWLEAIVIAGILLATAADPEQKRRTLAPLMAGEALWLPALFGPDARHDATRAGVRAQRYRDGWRLDGAKSFVVFGDAADGWIVSAQTVDGLSLFLVERGVTGLQIEPYRTHDGRRAAELRFDAVMLGANALLGPVHGALPLIEHTLGRALAASCAEACGVIDALLAQTVDHLKTRRQFGVPLASFQALQHRVAEMAMAAEQARAITWLATDQADAPAGAERTQALAAAKTLVGQSARFVGQQAVQLHGGIGVTDELPASHCFKRLTAIDLMFGDCDHHLARFSDAMRQEHAA